MKNFLIIYIALLSNFPLFSVELSEYSTRLKEVSDHPNATCRKLIREHKQFELVALELIDKSDSISKGLNRIYEKLKSDQIKWEQEHGEAFREAKEMTTKYRFETGSGVDELYRTWHKKKNKFAQSQPKINLEDLIMLLDEDHLKKYQEKLATLKFWYGSHGLHRRVMDLVVVGQSPKIALELAQAYANDVKDNKAKLRNGEPQKDMLQWIDFVEEKRVIQ